MKARRAQTLIQLHRDARRFETGTVDAPAFAALAESIRTPGKPGMGGDLHAGPLARGLARVRWQSSRRAHPDAQARRFGPLTFAVEGLDPERW